jgi:hypothetical protein
LAKTTITTRNETDGETTQWITIVILEVRITNTPTTDERPVTTPKMTGMDETTAVDPKTAVAAGAGLAPDLDLGLAIGTAVVTGRTALREVAADPKTDTDRGAIADAAEADLTVEIDPIAIMTVDDRADSGRVRFLATIQFPLLHLLDMSVWATLKWCPSRLQKLCPPCSSTPMMLP